VNTRSKKIEHTNPLPLGKLPASLLENIINQTSAKDSRLLLGPGIGNDCAIIAYNDRLLAIKSDPITFTSDQIGWYVVQVNANDIATTGAKPCWMLVTILLPSESTSANEVTRIQKQLDEACQEIGVSIVGGHTEITYNLDRPIVVGTMIGEMNLDQMVTPKGIHPGDKLLLTKGVPIEATAILASEFSNELKEIAHGINQADIDTARNFLYDPGISVLRDAQTAINSGEVHAMHDPTEGGLYASAWELAHASGCSLWVDPLHVPVLPLAKRFCEALQIDPLGSIASGALLIATPEPDSSTICSALLDDGIPCVEIGGVLERCEQPKVYIGPGTDAPMLPYKQTDEIARLYEKHE